MPSDALTAPEGRDGTCVVAASAREWPLFLGKFGELGRLALIQYQKHVTGDTGFRARDDFHADLKANGNGCNAFQLDHDRLVLRAADFILSRSVRMALACAFSACRRVTPSHNATCASSGMAGE